MNVQVLMNGIFNKKSFKGLGPGAMLELVLMTVLVLLLIPYAMEIVGVILFPTRVSVWRQLELYQWVTTGCVLYAFLRRKIKNIKILETFSHETTHMVVALLFGRRIHSIQCCDNGKGEIWTSGNNRLGVLLMTLAPYCLPVLTFLLLIIRPSVKTDALWYYDILVGISLSFHYFCFKNQTGLHQTDIQQYPVVFSLVFITLALLMNACVIWVAFFPDYNLFTSFWRMVCAVGQQFIGLF